MTSAAAPVLTMPQNAVAERFGEVLRVVFGRERHAVKRLASTAGASNRTAENWLRGENAPDALYMLRLMATVPEFAAEVRRLTAQQASLDPEFARDFARAVQTFQRAQEIAHAATVLDHGGALRHGDAAAAQPAREPAPRRGGALDAPARVLDDAAD